MTAHSHCLVVGGTGMLRGVTLALAGKWSAVSVIARTASRLQALAAEAPQRVTPIVAEWNDDESLQRGLADAVRRRGPVSLAVVWIHTTAARAPLIVADAVAQESRPCRYVHILGSGSDERAAVPQAWREALSRRPGISYQRVILGSAASQGGRRWLTHEEICAGVLHALEGDAETTWVGSKDS